MLVTFALIGGVAEANSAAANFCETAVVHNYAKPLEKMPSVRQVPADRLLPFGPPKVLLTRMNAGPLLLGPSTTGYMLSFVPSQPETRFSPPLNWVMEGRLLRVDSRGASIELIGRRRQEIKRLRSSYVRRSEINLSFDATKPGLYRSEATISTSSGERLGRFAEYVRVLAPTLDAELTLGRTSFSPGDHIDPKLENRGAAYLGFGLGSYFQRYDGTGWTRAHFGSGWAFAIGLSSGPGASAACWGKHIPMDAAPGRYRFRLEIDYLLHPLLGRRGKTLGVEFDVSG